MGAAKAQLHIGIIYIPDDAAEDVARDSFF